MKFLVTAGPTREHMDPVRFISNRSSGKMGFAVAEAAIRRGHEVRLVAGPVALAAPHGATVDRVVSAAEMLEAVLRSLAWCDALVMAAAVCDWRPAERHAQKVKKSAMAPVLRLERTPDILSSIRPSVGARIVVGFAAETENLAANAEAKLKEKRLDMIVANDVSGADSGFDVDTNQAVFLMAGGGAECLPLMTKLQLGERIVRWVETRAANQPA